MSKYFTNNFSVINLHRRPSVKSEIVTQMIYGDSFSISKKSKKWLKIKIKEDNYKGYIRNKKYSKYLKLFVFSPEGRIILSLLSSLHNL